MEFSLAEWRQKLVFIIYSDIYINNRNQASKHGCQGKKRPPRALQVFRVLAYFMACHCLYCSNLSPHVCRPENSSRQLHLHILQKHRGV